MAPSNNTEENTKLKAEQLRREAGAALLSDRNKSGCRNEVERFEIEPLHASDLQHVARFLHRWRHTESRDSALPQALAEDSQSIEKRLRWLLIDNPAVYDTLCPGYWLRDRKGASRGLCLSFPAAFTANGQRMTGLGAGSFFVDTPARSMGFFLLRKYLASPGCSFFFTTTCNASSAALWQSIGARAVPGSDVEYVLPLQLDATIPAFLASRGYNKITRNLIRGLSRLANPAWRALTARSSKLRVEPCQDWEKLAALARPGFSTTGQGARELSPDRTAEYLEWRYGPGSPHYPCDIFHFSDNLGNEGWFSLASMVRGGLGEIRGSMLLDVFWPREKMAFEPVFNAILCRAARGADAIFFRSRPGADYRSCSRWVIRRHLEAPKAFVYGGKGAAQLPLDAFDYDDIDNAAWAFVWR
jgi:hypothetical protein